MFERRRLPHVYRDIDRHGNVRFYFRGTRTGPKVRMPDDPSSDEFAAHYKQLRDGVAGQSPKVCKEPATNTYGWLVDEYLRLGIKGLDKLTQDKRRQLLEATKVELVTPDQAVTFAAFPLSRLQTEHLEVLRDRKAHVPNAQVNRVKAIKALFKWALTKKLVPINPACDLTVDPAPDHGGHHSWMVEEVGQFEERHPIGTKARLALALLLWTGVRRSDLVRLGKQHMVKIRDPNTNELVPALKFTQRKNRNRKPVQTTIPILPELQKVIEASPTGDLTFLVTGTGAPYTVWGFGNWFRDQCIEAGVPGRAHGLRKAGAATAAENGATTMQLMAWFGWLTIEQAEVYVRAAQRERMALAAMGTLVRR